MRWLLDTLCVLDAKYPYNATVRGAEVRGLLTHVTNVLF